MAVSKTDNSVEVNLVDPNQSKVYICQLLDARGLSYDITFDNMNRIVYEEYQIKETDMRVKTATFTTNLYLDLTGGKYLVWIISPHHENFWGVILSVEFDEDSQLYKYQCQDYSRDYISKFELVAQNVTVHRLMQFILTKGGISTKTKPSDATLKKYKPVLSGLRPAYQYEANLYDMPIKNWNIMDRHMSLMIRDKTYIETIRDIIYGSGACIDVHFNSKGVIQFQPYNYKQWLNEGVVLPAEFSNAHLKYDITDIVTGGIVNGSGFDAGTGYTSKKLFDIDLTAIFGNYSIAVNDPTPKATTTPTTTATASSAKTATKTATVKKAPTSTKTSNVYGTKKKVVYLNMDNINGSTADNKVMKSMATILKKNGWTVKIAGWGSESHYQKRGNVKKGIWFCLYGGVCAGTLREHGESSWFLNPLKKNKSRVVVGFFPPASSILKGGKYYKHIGPAHDWRGSSSYANLSYPAAWLSKHGVPFMYAKNAKNMVAKFLAGGDNYKTYGGGWKKHDVKWIK